jgi:hypothetical protein
MDKSWPIRSRYEPVEVRINAVATSEVRREYSVPMILLVAVTIALARVPWDTFTILVLFCRVTKASKEI